MARATLTLIRLAAALAAVLALGAAPAGATITWTGNGAVGGSPFAASGGPATFLIVPGLPGATVTTQCTTSGIDGTVYASDLGTEWPQAMRLNPTYGGCVTSGIHTTVGCTTIDGYYHAQQISSGVVYGFIQDYYCTISLPSLPCHITVAGNIYDTTYTNATGRFVVPVTGTPPTAGEDFNASVTTSGCASLFGSGQSSAHVRMGTKPPFGSEPTSWTLTVTSGTVPNISTDP